jgi:hypothetical protein
MQRRNSPASDQRGMGSNLVFVLLIFLAIGFKHVERHEVSRRLEEEAMSYFEECVPNFEFDGSYLSSLEDHLRSSTTCRSKLENDFFLSNEEIAFEESLISNNYEVGT